jgi:hypothetical protein
VARLLEITGADTLLDVRESAGLPGHADPAWTDPGTTE